MRFLADENFPGDAVAALRISGHYVLWIRTDAPGVRTSRDDWPGNFSVIEPGRIRVRALPPEPSGTPENQQ
jgi:hypothetical protein